MCLVLSSKDTGHHPEPARHVHKRARPLPLISLEHTTTESDATPGSKTDPKMQAGAITKADPKVTQSAASDEITTA